MEGRYRLLSLFFVDYFYIINCLLLLACCTIFLLLIILFSGILTWWLNRSCLFHGYGYLLLFSAWLRFYCIFVGYLLCWICIVCLCDPFIVFMVIWRSKMKGFRVCSLRLCFLLRDRRLIYSIVLLLCIFI